MHIWDNNLILTYYNSIANNEELDFKYLVKKIVMLYMIIGARRKHARFSLIYVDNFVFEDDTVILLPNKTLKHSKPKMKLQSLIYNAYK